MIPCLETYMVVCESCGYEKVGPSRDSDAYILLGQMLKRPNERKKCKCSQCGSKAEKAYCDQAS